MTKEEAREAIKEAYGNSEYTDEIIKTLEQEPILEKDGTLIVTTEHYEKVGRVLVQYGTNGSLFYQD